MPSMASGSYDPRAHELADLPAALPGKSDAQVTSWTTSCTNCCSCSRLACAKYGLFAVNFFVWVAGGVLIGVGIWSRLQRNPLAYAFDYVIVDMAYLLIGIGAVMFLISLFGCLGAMRESLCLIRTFVIAVVIVFVAQLVAGVLAFTLLDTVESTMMTHIRQAIVNYNETSASDTDAALNTLQIQHQCCGGVSYQDWETSAQYNCSSGSSVVTSCSTPDSCCQTPADNCGSRVRQYSEAYAEQVIHTRGCIGALMNMYKENLIIIGLIAFSVGILQVCSILMAHCLMRFLTEDIKFSF